MIRKKADADLHRIPSQSYTFLTRFLSPSSAPARSVLLDDGPGDRDSLGDQWKYLRGMGDRCEQESE